MHKILQSTIIIGALLLFFLSTVFVTAGEITPQLQGILDTAKPKEEIAVIVQLNDQVDRKQFKKFNKKLRRLNLLKELKKQSVVNQASLTSYLKSNGGKNMRSLWIINGFAVKANPSVIKKLAKRPEVLEVRLDNAVPLAVDSGSASAATQWNITMLDTDLVWAQGYRGQGVVVASMDSGVDYNHVDLAGNWRGGANSWFDPHGQHNLPYDANGHGTQTMGIMVGQNLGAMAIGMAPQAQWIAVKVFDDSGNALTSDIHAGFQWLLDPDNDPNTDDAPDIVNNSWGFPDTINSCETEFQPDIQTLRDLDINVVFSAGNQGGASSSISPANNPGAFVVGAVDQSGFVTSFSNQGPSACGQGGIYPGAVAPGYLVSTADLTFGGLFPNATMLVSGTSFAAPHVSGAMALLLSSNPALTPTDLETAITQTSIDLGDAGEDNVYGYGLVNVANALAYTPSSGQCSDADGDGFFAGASCGTPVDCNDRNPTIYPGAPEIAGDGIDQDCDGQDLQLCSDVDGDGYFAEASCGTPVDCNDNNPTIYPGAPEIAGDGIDQDCDGQDLQLCTDADGDGFFVEASCGTPVDCDDTNPAVAPGAMEVGYDGIDQNCDGYDLTINITRALYTTREDSIVIFATSSAGSNAGLEAFIPGMGTYALTWNNSKDRWQKTINKALKKGLKPKSGVIITVSGPEGAVSTPLTVN